MSNKFQFNPEINTGHILVCFTIIISSLGVFFTMRGDVETLKTDVREIKMNVNAMEEKVNSVYYKAKP